MKAQLQTRNEFILEAATFKAKKSVMHTATNFSALSAQVDYY